ncbi:uncharacterized protein LOC121725760 isoform X2 [Aricia agestis]|uniref:uncharacterized protein LOC121725760 isoform X2 n=1 Tax=Aricia agestis TaxID=91739 RepID=UPI001C2030E8|nr:uncharacterized protein LOC121725760 isoform X2 [Aricia agestis]
MFISKEKIVLLRLIYLSLVNTNIETFNVEERYHLVNETYVTARTLFLAGRASYDELKDRSRRAMDTFLDLARIMNEEMARDVRAAVLKYYRVKYLLDFSNYIVTLDEMVDIVEHCLIGPVEKMADIRSQFHAVIANFEDVRHFENVHRCRNELPDEVAAAHCILHQTVIFNETMQESLLSIVEIKTRQHVRRINQSLYDVQDCLNHMTPNFFKQLLIDSYTGTCGFLKVVDISARDLTNNKWHTPQHTKFLFKWHPVVSALEQRKLLPRNTKLLLLSALRTANITTSNIQKDLLE